MDKVNEEISGSRVVRTAGSRVKSEELPDTMLEDEASILNVPEVSMWMLVNVTTPFEV